MSERLRYLFERYINKTSSASEETELMGLALEEGKQAELKELLLAVWNEAGDADINDEKAEEFLGNIFQKPVMIRRINWRRIAVAASVILLLGAGLWIVVGKKEGKDIPHFVRDDKPQDVKAPESNRAMITLADGRKIFLDEAGNGELANVNGVKLVKLEDGKIEYMSLAALGMTKEMYNTLSNPRGSKVIDMTLSDGSHVWLNAGSSVTYPVAFVGNERKVSITGEAYFEVAPDKSKPFYVIKGDVNVQVLGTHFNMNAYEDELDIKLTLLEGSVKVTNKLRSLTIKPNQQAISNVNGELLIVNNPDLEAVMAWKNGNFQFNGAGINEVMKQLARWYDVEIEIKGNIPEHFGGTISREVNVSKVFEMLRLTGELNYKIEGRKIIVIP